MIKLAGRLVYTGIIIALCACGGRLPEKQAEPLQTAADYEARAVDAHRAGKYELADRYFNAAHELYLMFDRRHEQARTLVNLTQNALIINELNGAYDYLIALDVQIRYAELPEYQPRQKLLYGEYLIRSNRYNEAVHTLNEILTDPMTPQLLRHPALINRAVAAVNLHAPDAGQWLSRAEAAAGENNPLQKARLLRLRGQLAGAPDNTAELIGQALQIYRQARFPPGIAAGLAELGALELARNNTAAGKVLLQRALAIRLKMQDRHTAEKLLLDLHKLAQAEGDSAAANNYQAQLERLHNP
ncbi:MAG TPA: hypothetical protein VF268_01885 [Gammaproteobacteria bacterium]